jgi:hypothetical protein
MSWWFEKMQRTLRKKVYCLAVILFLAACTVEPPAASNPALEVQRITTTPILEVATLPVPSATSNPTVTPVGADIENCQTQDATIRKETYDLLDFGSSACKLLQTSLNGNSLVYVMLESPGREVLMVETAGVTDEMDWRSIAKEEGCGKCTVRDVQWAQDNTLILQITATTSGPAFVTVMDINGSELATIPGHLGQWNADQNAFYTLTENHWIFDAFGVYDFASGKSYRLEKFNGVKVSGWVGNLIYITVTPYEKVGESYCNLPAYAAQMELTSDGPVFNILKQAANSDVGVDASGLIRDTPYQRECSELMG